MNYATILNYSDSVVGINEMLRPVYSNVMSLVRDLLLCTYYFVPCTSSGFNMTLCHRKIFGKIKPMRYHCTPKSIS